MYVCIAMKIIIVRMYTIGITGLTYFVGLERLRRIRRVYIEEVAFKMVTMACEYETKDDIVGNL